MREERIRQLETRLAGWENRIDELEEELARSEAAIRNRYFRDLQDLKEKRDAARNRIAELRLRRAESWEDDDLQAGIIRVFDDIGSRINRLFSNVSNARH